MSFTDRDKIKLLAELTVIKAKLEKKLSSNELKKINKELKILETKINLTNVNKH